jgi:phenylalanyl-tRNA synthetase alpha chain
VPILELQRQFNADLEAVRSDADLKTLRDKYLGRKSGAITALMKALGAVPADERPARGAAINALKQHIESALDARAASLDAARRPAGAVDVTLPARPPLVGRLHPLTQLRSRIEAIFARQGYEILDGPETEDDWHCFEALNMPAEHPARDMQDTLYLTEPWDRPAGHVGTTSLVGGTEVPPARPEVPPARPEVPPARPEVPPARPVRADGPSGPSPRDTGAARPATLLRTHTSAMQIRYMESHEPPVRVIAPGRVYRRDNLDLTHTPMFQQVEGLVVGDDVTMADLKGTIVGFLRELFAPDIPVIFRPSFFPYTEPSADVFIGCQRCGGSGCSMCKRTGFIEVLGCGMVHPAVFEAVGYDAARVTGFAFGVGIERLALLMHGVEDIRLFYENDLRFLEQFPL